MNSEKRLQDFIVNEEDKRKTNEKRIPYLRLSQLLDADSFVEIGSKVRSRGFNPVFDRPAVEGDGVVTGYGRINDRNVFVAVQDFDVYGGSIGAMHSLKITDTIYRAIENELPFIYIIDSAGARIEEGILALEGLSGILSALNEARESIPVVAVILGHCPGGSAIAAQMAHFRIMSSQRGAAYMNGPMVTGAMEGKSLKGTDIGGTDIHGKKTGFASFVYDTDEEALSAVRDLMDYFPDVVDLDQIVCDDDPNRVEADLDIIASDMDKNYPVADVLNLIMDRGSLREVNSGYESGVITSLGKMDGFPVAVIANKDDRITKKQADKLKDFVEVTSLLGLPLISIVNASGFAIGVEEENANIISSAGKLFQEIDGYSSEKIALITGKAIGTAFLTLAGKNAGFDMVYAWPTARVAIVSPDTAANILYKDEIASADDIIKSRAEFTSKYATEIAAPEVAASYGHVDEIIYPSSSRPRLISALQMM